MTKYDCCDRNSCRVDETREDVAVLHFDKPPLLLYSTPFLIAAAGYISCVEWLDYIEAPRNALSERMFDIYRNGHDGISECTSFGRIGGGRGSYVYEGFPSNTPSYHALFLLCCIFLPCL